VEHSLDAVATAFAPAYVDGEAVYLTPKEWAIVDVLARNVGALVPGSHILFSVWGEMYWDEYHLLRVNMARIRTKLGAAKPLLETRFGMGYLLRLVPYTGPTP
jgi:two-component system KDP operon response regulator KdpE